VQPIAAKFVIFPTRDPYSTLAIVAYCNWLEPLGWVAHIERDLRIWLGLLVVVVVWRSCSPAIAALLRHGTNNNPLRPDHRAGTMGVISAAPRRSTREGGSPLCGSRIGLSLDWMLDP